MYTKQALKYALTCKTRTKTRWIFTLKRKEETSACLVTYPVELLLQFFIRIIDTELLKTVPVEGFEPAQRDKTTSDYRIISLVGLNRLWIQEHPVSQSSWLTHRCLTPL